MAKKSPSQAIYDIIEPALQAEANRRGLPLFIDKPPAAMYGKTGRPDLFVDLGPLHFRIEVKGKATEEPSENQKDYQRRDAHHVPNRSFTIMGKVEAQRFADSFPQILSFLLTSQLTYLQGMDDGMLRVADTLDYKHRLDFSAEFYLSDMWPEDHLKA